MLLKLRVAVLSGKQSWKSPNGNSWTARIFSSMSNGSAEVEEALRSARLALRHENESQPVKTLLRPMTRSAALELYADLREQHTARERSPQPRRTIVAYPKPYSRVPLVDLTVCEIADLSVTAHHPGQCLLR